MAQIITTSTSTNAGKVYYRLPGTAAVELTIPDGVSVCDVRPSFVPFHDRVLILGQFSPGLVFTPDLKLYKLGIANPLAAPTLATTTGTIIATGCDGYITWRQKLDNGSIFAESGPSPVSNSIALSTQGRSWTGLPISAPDSRVTHIAGWVSIEDTDPRFAWERLVGATSVTESMPTLALGAVLAEDVIAPPYTYFGEAYHNRVFYAGDPQNPERISFSELGLPETTTALNYLDTVGREPVTGIKRLGDELVVFTYNAVDVISDTDGGFTIRRVSSDIGCISHNTIVNIYDRLWFAAVSGIYVYDGGFRYVSSDIKDYWKYLYQNNPSKIENAWAEHDQAEFCYILDQQSTVTERIVAYYLPFEPNVGGSEALPWFFTDYKGRKETALGRVAESSRNLILVSGSSGTLWKENDYTDGTDASDSYDKLATIQTGHYNFDDNPGGSIEEGKTFTRVWCWLQCENDTWKLYFIPGDVSAPGNWFTTGNTNPKYITTAGTYSAGYVAQTVHDMSPDLRRGIERSTYPTGRGITLKWTITNPIGIKWQGFGGWWTPGPASRSKTSPT